MTRVLCCSSLRMRRVRLLEWAVSWFWTFPAPETRTPSNRSQEDAGGPWATRAWMVAASPSSISIHQVAPARPKAPTRPWSSPLLWPDHAMSNELGEAAADGSTSFGLAIRSETGAASHTVIASEENDEIDVLCKPQPDGGSECYLEYSGDPAVPIPTVSYHLE